ncbi:MAG TPA: hypothetical protein VNZ22_14490, partial [Bacillota bacterium]|nr:hypothetical protein [Bacillota bacterium]
MLVLLLEVPGGASGPAELPLESQVTRPGQGGVPGSEWRPGAARAQAFQTQGQWSLTPLQFRFLYETKLNETYLVTRHFTLWTNGVVASTLSVSNLVSGDGTTRWETNQVELVVERQQALRDADGNLEYAAGMPRSPAGKDAYRYMETEGVVFKLGSTVLARGLAKDSAMGISRVTIERYGLNCGSCSAAASLAPGRPGPLFGGVALRFGLGRTGHGQAVGELVFLTTTPTPAMWQPEALRLLALPEGVTVITDPNSRRLRQVGSSQCLADILKLDADGYRINFYATNTLLPGHDTGTLIPTNGLLPFVTWTIQNPDGAGGTNRLQVIESMGGLHITNTYTWQGAGQGWELLAGNGLRRQTWSSSWDARRNLRAEILRTFNPTDRQLVAQTITKYRRFDWGEGLVEEITGTGPQTLTATYSYWDRPGKPWHGRLQQVIRADGAWERYDFDLSGRIKTQYSPYGNTSPEDWRKGRATTYDYSPWTAFGDQANLYALRPRITTETVGGIVVARSYFLATTNHTIQLQCSSSSRVPFDGPALCTTNRYYPANDANATRLQSVDHPDGTLTLYTYSPGPAGFTTIIRSGQPNSDHTSIIHGTQTVAITGNVGQLLAKEVYDIAPGRTNLLTYRESYSYLDPLQRSYRVSYLDGTAEVYQYGCCGLEAWTDRDGLVILYAHDELKRLKTESRLVDGSQMLTTAYHYDAADHRLFSVRTGTDGTNRITLSGATYDTAGRPIYQTNALGGVTVLTYGADKEGRAVTTNRYADGGIRVETANRDGSLHQVHGSAVYGIRFDYGVAADGKLFTKETKLTQAGQPTEEWILHYADLLGRPCKTQYADGAFAQSFFNAQGQLFKERDPDGVITLYAYSPRGERTLTAVRTVATNRSDRIDFAGTDRIVQTLRDVCFNPALGTVVHRSRTFVWGAFQFNRSNLVASLETSVDGLKTWRILWNEGQGRTNLSSSSYGPGGLRHQSDYAPDGSCTYQRYRYGRLELNETRDAAGTALLQTVYEYDA